VVSGSETQLISLWKVADEATRVLMVDYYRRVLGGAGRIDALREAQLAMLANPETRHPYYWAAFIGAGQGTSLAGEPPPTVRVVETGNAARGLRSRRGCGCDGGPGSGGAIGGVALALLAGLAVRRRRAG
jgi:MYXO-CTERM domain-containing protein